MVLTLVSIIAPILLAISYVPQIIKLFKSKVSTGISLAFWIILDLTLACFVFLAWSSNDIRMLFMQGLNLLLALIITMQVWAYGGKE